MLSPELLRRVRRTFLRTQRRVSTLMAGEYRSAFRGAGVEFEEVREYHPGDDVRTIDWNVTARMRRPHVKRYREERELEVWLLVDLSGSSVFGTGAAPRRETMVEAAALLAFTAVHSNDRIGAVLYSDRLEGFFPCRKGTAQIWRIVRAASSCEPRGKGTDLAGALRLLRGVARRGAVVFLVSDFLDHGCAPALAAAARRHDLVGVVVSDPGDLTLPGGGLVRARDIETGARLLIDTSTPDRAAAVAARLRARHDRSLRMLRAAGADVVELSTAGPLAEPLESFFRERERRRSR